MEHESFEDDEVAEIMNAHFICMSKWIGRNGLMLTNLYMNAAQLITGGGGWPLNCFRASRTGGRFMQGRIIKKTNGLQLLETITERMGGKPR